MVNTYLNKNPNNERKLKVNSTTEDAQPPLFQYLISLAYGL
jgi:hypothetical protein